MKLYFPDSIPRVPGEAPSLPDRWPIIRHDSPEHYLPDPALVDAVNVALILGRPLLVTGEPGTGKTQLAYSVSANLGLAEPLKFETKSTSTARDLFYTYDSLARFHAAQVRDIDRRTADFITYNALGVAIVRANEASAVAPYLPQGFEHGGRRRSVVLIDEIDKAPRDFPNDVLNEIEGMYFRVPELGNVAIGADRQMQPVVIVTSNSERNLPDAFLRRCAYFNLPFPDKEHLSRIVVARLADLNDEPSSIAHSVFLSSALDLFYLFREQKVGLKKPPSTSELIDWLYVLRRQYPGVVNPLVASTEAVTRTISCLIKTGPDQDKALEAYKASRKGPPR